MTTLTHRHTLALVLLLAVAAMPAVLSAKPDEIMKTPPDRPMLGINLAGPADWNTELPFVDVFHFSRPWISQQKDKPRGEGPALDLDEHGWVRRLEPDCWAETPLCTIDGGHYPAGRYTVLYKGQGRLEFSGTATAVSSEPGRTLIEVDPAKGGFFLKLMATSPDNPVRDIHVIMPGFEKTFDSQPFHPAFLKRWQGVACIRFMDWMNTNGSPVTTWSQRPTPADASYAARGGVPLEVMLDLCNRLKADAWFCMPHMADDDYIRRFAQMASEKLAPGLKIYIEYSNEVWNSQFPQYQYSLDMAKKLEIGPAERLWEGGGMYYARRSVEIFKIWLEVFGGRDRLVRVLAWQSGNTWWMENIVLIYKNAWKQADALAIAPYLMMSVPVEGKGLTAGKAAGWTVDQALDYLEATALPESARAIAATREVATRLGLALIAYEGGQHMVGIGGGENNEAMTRLFVQANGSPHMGAIYGKYLETWKNAFGGLFCHFNSVGVWGKWGSWGTMQFYDDDPAKSPKYAAIMEWARDCGQSVNAPGSGRQGR